MKRFLHRQSGITLPELVVVVAVLAITSALLVPKLLNDTNGTNDQGAINTLDSGWEVGQEYYQGKRGEGETSGAPDQYNGFDSSSAWKLAPKMLWLSSPSASLDPGKSTQDKVYIAIAGDSSDTSNDNTGNTGQILGLCTASQTLVFCKYDDGFPGGALNSADRKLGPRYGASKSSQTEALCRAKRVNSPNTASAGLARAEALKSSAGCA